MTASTARPPTSEIPCRITSYNVCYTKLLRRRAADEVAGERRREHRERRADQRPAALGGEPAEAGGEEHAHPHHSEVDGAGRPAPAVAQRRRETARLGEAVERGERIEPGERSGERVENSYNFV